MSMPLRFALAAALAFGLAGCGSMSALDNIITGSVEPTGPVPPAAGKVYIFRGMGGRIASFEMDNLTEKLKRSGINSETYNHVNWRGPGRRGDRALQVRDPQIPDHRRRAFGRRRCLHSFRRAAEGSQCSGQPDRILRSDALWRPRAAECRPLHQRLVVDQFLRRRQYRSRQLVPRPLCERRSAPLLGRAACQPGPDRRAAGPRDREDGADHESAGASRRRRRCRSAMRRRATRRSNCGIPACRSAPRRATPSARSREKYAVPVWAVTQLNDISVSTPLHAGPTHCRSAPSRADVAGAHVTAHNPPMTSYAPR